MIHGRRLTHNAPFWCGLREFDATPPAKGILQRRAWTCPACVAAWTAAQSGQIRHALAFSRMVRHNSKRRASA